jgi:polyhydroxyalkanoate synthesis regulator phasin
MESGGGNDSQRGISENLREAIERTFAATAESAAGTRGRAQELLDEVSRRGQGAREVVAQRGQEARDASSGAAARVIEAVEGMRLPSREDLRELQDRLGALERRLAALESQDRLAGLERRVAALESRSRPTE